MKQEPDANPWHNHRTFRPKIMAILKENNLVTFEQRQDVGTEGEKIFCDYLRKQGLDPITIDQPFKPFDVFESISGTTYKVESCFEAWKDDTIFIELRMGICYAQRHFSHSNRRFKKYNCTRKLFSCANYREDKSTADNNSKS